MSSVQVKVAAVLPMYLVQKRRTPFDNLSFVNN